MQIDFAVLMTTLPTVSVIEYLNAEYTLEGSYVKTRCPFCMGVISFCTQGAKRNVGYCLEEKKGFNLLQWAEKWTGRPIREVAGELAAAILKLRKATNKPLNLDLELHPHPAYHPDLQKDLEFGICRKGTMAGHLAFTIYDHEGNKIAYVGKHLKNGQWKSPKNFVHEVVLWNIHRIEGNTVYILNCYEKCAWLYFYGVPCVATFGNVILTKQQIDLIRRFKFINFLQNDQDVFDAITISMAKEMKSYWRLLRIPKDEKSIVDIL